MLRLWLKKIKKIKKLREGKPKSSRSILYDIQLTYLRIQWMKMMCSKCLVLFPFHACVPIYQLYYKSYNFRIFSLLFLEEDTCNFDLKVSHISLKISRQKYPLNFHKSTSNSNLVFSNQISTKYNNTFSLQCVNCN